MQQATTVAAASATGHMQLVSPKSGQIFRHEFLIMLALLLLAATLRLYGITAHAPQSDERLWVGRSARVLHTLKSNPKKATTHLPHPGIPAAVTMAGAQWLNQKIASLQGLSKPKYSEREASRMAMALLACLVIPVLFFGTRSILGNGPAILATGLFAFDPKFVGLSRIAHIDTTLTLIATTTVLLYLHAVRTRSLRLKLLAGIFWGLCICTKPTSVAIIPMFLLWRALRAAFSSQLSSESEKGLFSWSDLWAVILGHLTLACLYTRLWTHRSDYHDRMHIRIKLAGWFWHTGKVLRPYLFELLGACAVVLMLSLLCLQRAKSSSKRLWHHLGLLGITATFLFSTFLLFPQVYENLARFWKWVFSLSGESHESFSHIVVEPTGYLHLFFTELPSMTAVGFLVGIAALILRFRKNLNVQAMERAIFLIGLLLVPLCWISLISISSKQAWRYALPSTGCLYIITGFGLWHLLKPVQKLAHAKGILSVCVIALISWQGLTAFLWYPNYHIYFNSLSGGLAGALTRGHPFTFTGQPDAVRFLMKEQERLDADQLSITTFGDSESLEDMAGRLFPEKPDKSLEFKYYKRYVADYAITFDSHPGLVARNGWEDVLSQAPAHESIFKGARVLAVYAVPPYRFDLPLHIGALDGHHLSGREGRVPGVKGVFLTALPKRDKAGHVFFTSGYRAVAGNYRFSAEMLAFDSPAEITPSDTIAELQMGKCKEVIRMSDLSTQLQSFSLHCAKANDGRIRPVIFWQGNAPIAVKQISIERLPDALQ